jgi:hypothetical protein
MESSVAPSIIWKASFDYGAAALSPAEKVAPSLVVLSKPELNAPFCMMGGGGGEWDCDISDVNIEMKPQYIVVVVLRTAGFPRIKNPSL